MDLHRASVFVAVAEPAAAARESLALRLGSTGRRNIQITHIHAFIHTNVRMYIRTHIHLHTCQHMYTYAQSCLELLRTTSARIWIDVCIYIYIYIYIYTCIQTKSHECPSHSKQDPTVWADDA